VALSSSETSVLTRATWRNIAEDGIINTLFRVTCTVGDVHYYVTAGNEGQGDGQKRIADKFTPIFEQTVGNSTSHKPASPHGLVQV
jgi:hypothetical protein